MKKQRLNLAHKYFKYWRKYRNLYLRLSEMLKSGIYQTLNIQAQTALQRKLDIYYRRLVGNRLTRSVKVAMLTASFAFITQVMQAQVDTIWAKMPAENIPFKEININPLRNLVVDVNNDGLDDIIARNEGNRLALFQQTTDPNNRFIEDQDWARSKTMLSYTMSDYKGSWTDFDQDGDWDALYIDAYATPSVRLFENDGNFNYTELTGANNPFNSLTEVAKMALMDVDADGDLDVLIHEKYFYALANITYYNKVAYLNNSGDETFNLGARQQFPSFMDDLPNSSNTPYKAMFTLDVDGDGSNDLVINESNGDVEAFKINASGNFEQFIGSTEPHYPLFIDVDDDNDLDLVRCGVHRGITNLNNDTRFDLEYNTEFISPAPFYTKESALPHQFVDVDNDGDLDLMMSEYEYSNDPYFYGDVLKVYENTGDAQNPEFSLTKEWIDHKFADFSLTNNGEINNGFLVNLDNDTDLELLVMYKNYSLYYYDYDSNSDAIVETEALGNIFTNPTEQGALDNTPINVVDFDMDGDDDIFFGLYSYSDYTYKRIYIENTGTKAAPEWTTREAAENPLNVVPTEASGKNLHFVDLNNDGKMDYFICNDSFWNYQKNTSGENGYSFATTSANTSYGQSSSYAPNFKHLVDLNGNGKPEIYTSNTNFKYGYIFEYLPKFELPAATFTLNENVVGELVVSNLQSVDNIDIDIKDFVITGGNDLELFELVGTTNELRLKADATIDYETVQEVVLDVSMEAFQATKKKAEHPGYNSEGSTTAKITIKVNNLNDNTPVISTIANDLSVNENSATGTELVTITANDADGDLNTLVFSTTETKVAIDETTGVVTIVDESYFDAETNTNLSFDVKVSDGTNEDVETVNIAINNVNDNAPVLTAIASDLNVDENSAVGTELLTLAATDADGDLNTLTYSSDENKIAVDAATGKVTIADLTAFDFETAQTLNFDVKVSDGTNEDTETISIAINNVNDNAPEFATIASDLNIDENSASGTELLTLSASDADGDLNSLTYSSDDTKVTIDATTGAVTLAADVVLDYETATSLSFDVKVSDGTNEDTETVTIAINNVNDNSPALATIAADLNVDENSEVGTELLTLSATDADGDLNSLTYSSEDTKIDIDETTGVVTVVDASYFDAETNTSISFDVKVSDGTNQDTETVTIAINNVNDNAPVFEKESYEITLIENQINEQAILKLKASDADNLGDLTYTLSDGLNVFTLSETGELKVSDIANIDVTKDTAVYELSATVSDGELTDNATLTVKIDITTGIVTIKRNIKAKLYPNPANEKVTIEIPELNSEATISIYNMSGVLVMQETVNSQKSTIQLNDFNHGVYLVKIQTENKTINKQLVVK